jgi:hypothetical protein
MASLVHYFQSNPTSFQCSSGTASRGNKSLRATGSINNDEIAARYQLPCRGFLKHIVLYKYTHECTLYITRNNKHVEESSWLKCLNSFVNYNSELMLLPFNNKKIIIN